MSRTVIATLPKSKMQANATAPGDPTLANLPIELLHDIGDLLDTVEVAYLSLYGRELNTKLGRSRMYLAS